MQNVEVMPYNMQSPNSWCVSHFSCWAIIYSSKASNVYFLNFPYLQILLLSLLQHWLASQVNPELLEDALVHIAQHHGAMHLATSELRQLLQSLLAVLVVL